MSYDRYIQYIYQWLVDSGLDSNIVQVLNKIDGLALQFSELLAYVSSALGLITFFGFLWFAMQFIQKRWYTS